jgi:hyperosmotically inducible protein
MNKRKFILPIALLMLGGSVGQLPLHSASADQPAANTPADNTGKNVRDRNDAAVTPLDQGNSKGDRTLTQRIRRAVVADKSLSTNAKNIKIISRHGMVTLRGPVKTEEERAKIAAKAQQIAGEKNVDNQLEVATK